jgi:hypothetical protein
MNLFAASDSEMEEEDVVDVTDEYMTAGSQGRRPEAGTLVVCPTAVLNQWATEIEDKVPLPFHNAWLSAKWLVTLLRFDLQNLCSRVSDGSVSEQHPQLTSEHAVCSRIFLIFARWTARLESPLQFTTGRTRFGIPRSDPGDPDLGKSEH